MVVLEIITRKKIDDIIISNRSSTLGTFSIKISLVRHVSKMIQIEFFQKQFLFFFKIEEKLCHGNSCTKCCYNLIHDLMILNHFSNMYIDYHYAKCVHHA